MYSLAMMRADSDRALHGYRRRKFARLNLGATGGTVLVSLLSTVVLFAPLSIHFV
jgi:hypothetical protein